MVPKLDRLARSVPDARHIGDSLVTRGIKLSLGGTIYDPADPLGKMFFNILATFAEFEVDLLRLRTREGMAVARAKGKLKGKQPKLTPRQQTELTRMHATGEYTIADLMEVFSVGRATVYPPLSAPAPTPVPAVSGDRGGGRRHQARGACASCSARRGVTFQRLKTWKTCKDPRYASKKARIE